ncbi:hypothetical protein NDN08_001853 [Rhodosorus marinus]|uniref:ATP-dependent RNA helicase n=1 Tax=Rhodosorus marinus TaxID=101924 RepID=A0AAV8US25_9RHOD|nr:hypothetical protein NDN08_001853 [Rhodosorus marinus]
MDGFEALGVKKWLLRSCESLGMRQPTEVQEAAIPAALEGRSVLASAETGSGKTAAFVIPILQKLAEDPFGVFAVILEPTRELALQVYETVHALGAGKNVKVVAVVGGVDMVDQGMSLSRIPHIIVATPGRLADCTRREDVDLSRVKFVVLDEADRLLEGAFSEDLAAILDGANEENRQTLLFSATVSKKVKALAENFSEGVFRFDAKSTKYKTVEQLVQEYYLVPEDFKDAYLAHILTKQFQEKSSVVFVSRKSTCENLLFLLRELGVNGVSLHSGMKQSEREKALEQFKSSTKKLLIATDLASRGLDVPYVELVVNYDVPDRVSTYVHRVGRTARIGRPGVAISLISQYDVYLAQNIEEKLNLKLELRENADKIEREIASDLVSKVTMARRLAKYAVADHRSSKGANKADQKPGRSRKKRRKVGR